MKIKYSLLPIWNKANLTDKESDLLLYIIRYQDDHGCIRGVFYQDVCNNADMCKQTFYNTLRNLQRKGIISYERVNQDYDITILNNDFSYPDSYKEGYINVGRKIFHSKIYRDLKAKEKMLLLEFMKITHSASGSYQIGTGKFYEKYMQLLGVTKRALRGYLHSLRKFFAIGIKDGKYFISYLITVFREKVAESEADQFMGHLVDVSCRRAKIKEMEDADKRETITLMKQYRQEAKENETGKSIFSVVEECISASVQNTKIKVLNSKYIHKLLRATLGLQSRTTLDGEI